MADPKALVIKNTDYIDTNGEWKNKDIFDIPSSIEKGALSFVTNNIVKDLSINGNQQVLQVKLDARTKMPYINMTLQTIARSVDCYKAQLAINDIIIPPQNNNPQWKLVNFFNMMTFGRNTVTFGGTVTNDAFDYELDLHAIRKNIGDNDFIVFNKPINDFNASSASI